MPSPLQEIINRLTVLESKIDQIFVQPVVPTEVNLEGITSLLGQILVLVTQINTNTSPEQPDLISQGQQLYAQLQQQIQQALLTLQQFQNQIQQPIIPE